MTAADAVVIGAGHNGLALATALARAGYVTTLLESEEQVGGMARSDRALGEGEVHHPHATFLGYRTVMPLRAELRRAGLRWVVPEAQHAIVFADGRPGIVIHRRDLLARTRRSVARYCAADADLLVSLLARATRITGAMGTFLTSAPSRAAVARYLASIQEAYAGLPVLQRLGSRSVAQLVQESFTSPEVRTFLLMLAHELGSDVMEPGSDVGFLGVVCRMIGDRAVPVGGMGTLVAAYEDIARRAGVEIHCRTQVERIAVAGSSAVGAVTADGREIGARRLVASALPRQQTRSLLDGGEGPMPEPALPGATDVIKQHVVLSEAPRFTSADGEPDVSQAVQTFFGWDDTGAVAGRLAEIRGGLLPAPGGALLRPALADPSQSSTPDRLLAVDSTFASLALLTADERQAVQAGFPTATVQRLSDYAPNVTEDAVRKSVMAPLSPVPRSVALDSSGSDHYRSPDVGRMYLGGTDRHPGSGIHGACGWNAASVAIADTALPARAPGLRRKAHLA